MHLQKLFNTNKDVKLLYRINKLYLKMNATIASNNHDVTQEKLYELAEQLDGETDDYAEDELRKFKLRTHHIVHK